MKLFIQKFQTLLFFFFLLGFQTAFSQPYYLKDTIPQDPNVKIGKLQNGLTYYIRDNGKLFSNVQLRLVVNAGSVLEDDNQQGLAHFMEHMNFNGLKHFPKNELVSYLESNGLKFGADLNAFTGFDATNYILWLTTEDNKKLDKGFTILEDWEHNALLDHNEIDKERGVVLEESRLNKNAGDRMRALFFPILLNGSKYAERLPIGKDSILETFKPDVLKRFYDTWYRPDLSAVIVVGNIDTLFIQKEIDKHFAKYTNPINETKKPEDAPPILRKHDEALIITDKELQGTSLEIFEPFKRKSSIITWGDYRYSIVENIFRMMINDRLHEIAQGDNAPFLSGNVSHFEIIKGYSSLNFSLAISDKAVKNAVNALTTCLQSIKQFGFLAPELERAKNKLSNQNEKMFLDKDKTPSAKFAQDYATNFMSGTPVISIDDHYVFYKQVLKTINLDEVNALGNTLENDEGKFALLIAPEKNKEALPSNSQLLAMLADSKKMPITQYAEKSLGNSLFEKLPVAGSITKEENIETIGLTTLTFENGISVSIKSTEFKNDDIQMDAWRWGGSHNFSLADKQNALNAARIVESSGINHFARLDLEKFLSGKTVNVHPYINPYEDGIEGKCSAHDFETFLQLINLYFTAPAKNDNAFTTFINKQKSIYQNIKANPQNYFADSVIRMEYQNNPWAPTIPASSDFDNINADRAYSIYKEIFSNAYGMHFTFVGNIDIKKAKPLLELYLGSLPTVTKENKFNDEGLRMAKGIVEAEVKKGEAKQSQINLVFTGETSSSQLDDLKLKMLCEVINIKIFEQLREKMSGIYSGSISSSFIKRPYEHYQINIRIPCGAENIDKLTKALFEIINDTREGNIDKRYLNKVREMMVKHHAGQMLTNEYWLQWLSHCWIDREDPEWTANFYYKSANAINVDDLKETALKYFNMNNYFKFVLTPE